MSSVKSEMTARKVIGLVIFCVGIYYTIGNLIAWSALSIVREYGFLFLFEDVIGSIMIVSVVIDALILLLGFCIFSDSRAEMIGSDIKRFKNFFSILFAAKRPQPTVAVKRVTKSKRVVKTTKIVTKKPVSTPKRVAKTTKNTTFIALIDSFIETPKK